MTEFLRNRNPCANVFLMVNLGCEMIFVIDQRLKAQRLPQQKAEQGDNLTKIFARKRISCFSL